MSDATHAPEQSGDEPGAGPGPSSLRRRLLWVLVLFVGGGAAAGVLWERLAEPATGLAYEGGWYLEPAGPDLSFQAVALYVVIAFPLGLLLAVLVGRWRGHERVTVLAVLVAAGLGAAAMYAVGHALGPPDPQALAAGSPDYTELPAELGLTAPDRDSVPWHSTALLALPGGAMLGLVGSYLGGNWATARRARG
ncbi:hypothetical protein [Nocardioides sp. zg-1228]|uniref:hypothetical protein n=1 Tax=Nocardioides sp. zg-1228 TaxID=2763008 RepID=UPI001642A61B|nr:hypothetical protein [Nocardioides sp. zg-1228]MBC2933551.1 hypothetical protein [Nocardioides sp. zg-1228]QSF56321.1 hypothetical protein JX575_11655 [Nocardioides sp. zg-1228]